MCHLRIHQLGMIPCFGHGRHQEISSSHVIARCLPTQHNKHQLSSDNGCFAILSVQTMWSARQSQDEGKSAKPLTLRMRSQLSAMQRDLTCSPLQLGRVLSQATRFPPLPAGPLRSLSLKLGPHQTSGAVGVQFAPTTGAQSAGPFDLSTTERASRRADFESWFRHAARGVVARAWCVRFCRNQLLAVIFQESL